MAIVLALCTVVSTALGGIFALRNRDRLHLVLGFTAGVLLGSGVLRPAARGVHARRPADLPRPAVGVLRAGPRLPAAARRRAHADPAPRPRGRVLRAQPPGGRPGLGGRARPALVPRRRRHRAGLPGQQHGRAGGRPGGHRPRLRRRAQHGEPDGQPRQQRPPGQGHARRWTPPLRRSAPRARCSSRCPTTCSRSTWRSSAASCSTSRPATSCPRRTRGTRRGSPCSARSAASRSSPPWSRSPRPETGPSGPRPRWHRRPRRTGGRASAYVSTARHRSRRSTSGHSTLSKTSSAYADCQSWKLREPLLAGRAPEHVDVGQVRLVEVPLDGALVDPGRVEPAGRDLARRSREPRRRSRPGRRS